MFYPFSAGIVIVTNNVKSLFDMESSALEDEILTLQNEIEIKARSTSGQPEEHVVFWKLVVADKCPNLRSGALNLTAFFGSTYLCESAFLHMKIINTFATSLRIYRTSKSGKNRLTYQLHSSQLIALESCSNPQKTRQVFQSAMKKNVCFGFRVLCE